ncbi:MAG: hypothetical protein K2X39_03625 [Silvanigrellaceae bacterium]|nr:hypothetical protein [Silvanigrellaceae bacterium]
MLFTAAATTITVGFLIKTAIGTGVVTGVAGVVGGAGIVAIYNNWRNGEKPEEESLEKCQEERVNNLNETVNNVSGLRNRFTKNATKDADKVEENINNFSSASQHIKKEEEKINGLISKLETSLEGKKQELQKVTQRLHETQKEFDAAKSLLTKEKEHLIEQNKELKASVEHFKASLKEFDNEKESLIHAKEKIKEFETEIQNLKQQPNPNQNFASKIQALEKKVESLSQSNARLALLNNTYRETIVALKAEPDASFSQQATATNRPGFFN